MRPWSELLSTVSPRRWERGTELVRQNTIRRAKKKAERAVNQTWTHSLNESMRRVRCEHRDARGVFGAIFRGIPPECVHCVARALVHSGGSVDQH